MFEITWGYGLYRLLTNFFTPCWPSYRCLAESLLLSFMHFLGTKAKTALFLH